MRRSMLVATLIALAMFAGACGRLNDNGSGGGNGAGSGGIEHPTGAGDLILQVGVSGGFVAPSTTLTQFPGFSLYGDGTLITQGAQTEIYPGPALPAMIQTHVSEDGIQAILQAAQTAGLFGPDTSYGYNCIADVGTTTFVVNAEGSTHTIDTSSRSSTPSWATCAAGSRPAPWARTRRTPSPRSGSTCSPTPASTPT
jgi:hypothetical protein